MAKIKYGGGQGGTEGQKGKGTPTGAPNPTQPPFNPIKSDKPEIKFFIMSFCPYGNQAEAGLEPVYQLLKDKVTWSPRYIVSKIDQATIDSCKQNCPQRIFNDAAKQQCDQAIKDGQVKDMATCQQYFPYTTAEECVKAECLTLKVGTFESLHGSQELNQDVREICAYNLGNLSNWWGFVKLVNEKCNSNDADTCWGQQAKDANLDAAKISACEESQKSALLSKEIAETTKFEASGSPTVFINGTLYSGGRAPEDYKKAICLAFKSLPAECATILGQETAASSGGCQ